MNILVLYIYVCVCMCVYVYMYIHSTYTHTHICIWQDHKNVLSTVLELFKTVRFCQWNLGGKIQAHRTLFTAGLGFESTTQMIGL